MKCSHPTCDRQTVARGLCPMHYKRMRLHGTTGSIRRDHGAGCICSGYVRVGTRKTPVHRIVAEASLGHPLPDHAEVHHVNGNRLDNRPENLVICPNRAYHALLHLRAAALENCGNPAWRKCTFCKAYDDQAQLVSINRGTARAHRSCINQYNREKYSKSTQQRIER